MQVGHGDAGLKVRPGEQMGGYADRAGGVSGELDPLRVHAVVVTASGRRFALVVADLVCVNADVVAVVRRELTAAYDVDACWVTATHTHAGPESGCEPGGAATPPDLRARLVAAVLSAVGAAVRDESPGSVHALPRVLVDDVGSRRSATVPEPRALPVDGLVVRNPDGGVRGVLAVVPVHPTVLPDGNRDASADLAGGIRRALAALMPGSWAVVATGAAGDQSTRHTRRGRDLAEVDRLGDLVARRVAGQLDRDAPPAGTESADLPVSTTVTLAAKRAGDLPALDQLARTPGAGTGRTQRTFDQGLEIAAGLIADGARAEYRVEVEAVRLGAVVLVAVPGEPFLELGERIRAGAPDPERTVVLGYANGYLGYLPTAAAFDEPAYEVLASPVGPGAGEQVVEAAIRLTSQIEQIEEKVR